MRQIRVMSVAQRCHIHVPCVAPARRIRLTSCLTALCHVQVTCVSSGNTLPVQTRQPVPEPPILASPPTHCPSSLRAFLRGDVETPALGPSESQQGQRHGQSLRCVDCASRVLHSREIRIKCAARWRKGARRCCSGRPLHGKEGCRHCGTPFRQALPLIIYECTYENPGRAPYVGIYSPIRDRGPLRTNRATVVPVYSRCSETQSPAVSGTDETLPTNAEWCSGPATSH